MLAGSDAARPVAAQSNICVLYRERVAPNVITLSARPCALHARVCVARRRRHCTTGNAACAKTKRKELHYIPLPLVGTLSALMLSALLELMSQV